MPPVRTWLAGPRPRTLPAALVPVLVGTAAAVGVAPQGIAWWRAAAALVAAIGIQVGTNYANDYSDGRRGTDDPGRRVGPVRLVGWGLASPGAVRRAAVVAFGVAAAAGLALAVAVDLRLIAVGAASFAAGWLYTGGPRPYGYAGLGEAFVFVFFGVVATTGAAYVQTEEFSGLALGASLPVGLLATALLVVNNLRDIPWDTASGKRTLAVRIGDPATRHLYLGLVGGAFVAAAGIAVLGRPAVALIALSIPLAVRPARRVAAGASGADLIEVLGNTGRLQLAFGVLLAAGLATSG